MFSFSTYAVTTTTQSTKPDLLNALAALNAATPAPTILALAPYQKPAVIYFALRGCIHCQKLSPVWSAAVSPMRIQHPHVTFSKLEWDPDKPNSFEHLEPLRKGLQITNFPCIVIIRDGAEVARITGMTQDIESEAALSTWLNAILVPIQSQL